MNNSDSTIIICVIIGMIGIKALNWIKENQKAIINALIIIGISALIILILTLISIKIIKKRAFLRKKTSEKKTMKKPFKKSLGKNEKPLKKHLHKFKIKKQNITKEKLIKSAEIIKPKSPVKSECESSPEKPKVKVSINVDEFKGFYKYRNLNSDEVNYLKVKGYKEVEKFSINSNKKEKFLIKPRYNEGLGHAFLVYDINEYLIKKADKVQLFTANKPDIVFTINNRKIAVEVETGKVLKKKKQFLNKVKILNKTYDKWFFAVTDKNLFPKYKEYGETADKRTIANKINKIIKNAS